MQARGVSSLWITIDSSGDACYWCTFTSFFYSLNSTTYGMCFSNNC